MVSRTKYAAVATDSPSKLPVPSLNQEVLSVSMAGSGQKRNYEVFPGRNKICCGGRVIMSHQAGIFYLTVGLIVVTCGLFFAFDAVYLGTKVSWSIPVVGYLLFIFVLSTLFRTACMDPGIIPRANKDEAAWIESQIGDVDTVQSGGYRAPPRTRDVEIKGQQFKLKYCFTCKIFRPPRASHCSVCDNCVERFDHHCPWVGNCVGKRNYRFFYLFLVSLSILCMYIFGGVIANIVLRSQESSFVDALKKSPASVLEGGVAFFSLVAVLGMCVYHLLVAGKDMTSNEDIKGTFNPKRNNSMTNPFSRGGCCSNTCYIVCGPFSPSLINLRGIAEPEAEAITTNGRTEARSRQATSTFSGAYPKQPEAPAGGGGREAANSHSGGGGGASDGAAADPTIGRGSAEEGRQSRVSWTEGPGVSDAVPV